MRRIPPSLAVSAFLVLTGLGTHAVGQQERGIARPSSSVRVLDAPGSKRVEIRGDLFTEYRYEGHRQPILYPVLGPGGVRMTRDFPMGITEGEARDHAHQQSLWFAHGDVNGHDFWSGGDGSRIVHAGFLPVEGTDAIRTKNRWEDGEGKVICEDERLLRFGGGEAARWIDYAVTIHASAGALRMGDTKEGTMGIRMAASLRLEGPVAGGSAVNSEGLTDGDLWGERAKWIDYFGPVGEATVGIAIFDHPDNPRHPTWWHARDYGLAAANPFGVHDFEGAAAGTGDLVVEEGEKVTFRYRFYFHLGDAVAARVSEQYEIFLEGTWPKEQE